jgi:hypothetical protein
MASVTTTVIAIGNAANGKSVIANANGATRAVRTETGAATAKDMAAASGTATAAIIDRA